MPAITFEKYNINDTDLNSIGESEWKQRSNAIARYWRYYFGDHDRFLKAVPGKHDDNVVFNLCGQAVDKLNAFLFPRPPVYIFDKGNDELSEASDELWDSNSEELFLTDIGLGGHVSGHVFIRISVDEDGPKFTLLDTRTVVVFWKQRKIDDVLWYRIIWTEGNKTFYQDIIPNKYRYSNPDLEGWSIITYASDFREGWRIIEEELWEYDVPPIVDWKNEPSPHTFYGLSTLRHYIVNDALNFIASNTLRIIKFHAHPRTIVTGASGEDIVEVAVDEAWAIANSQAKAYNMEMQSDLRASMEMMDRARASFFSQTRVVDMATNKDKIGEITNFGLHVLFADMMDLIKVQRQLFGKGLVKLTVYALQLLGHAVELKKTKILWEDPLPVDRNAQVNAATVEQRLGFTSDETLAEDLDRDYALETARITREQRRKMDQQIAQNTKMIQAGLMADPTKQPEPSEAPPKKKNDNS